MSMRGSVLWLVVLAVLGWCAGCSPKQKSPPPSSLPLGAARADCSAASDWVPDHAYADGEQVKNRGNLYQCKPWPYTAHCAKATHEPGGDGGGGVWWPEAWDDLGACTIDEIEGNELVLVLPPAPARSQREAEVTGTLRCPGEPAEEHAITGSWGQELRIDGLKRCDYHLVMNVAGGSRPLNTPAIVSYSENEKQSETFRAEYAEPLDLSGLVALPGLRIELFAQGLIQPRQMALGDNVLYVGSSRIPYGDASSKISEFVYALPLDPGTGKPTGLHLVATGLIEPHGVAYRDGDLYYATTGDLYRLRDADTAYANPKPERVLRFPADDKRFPLPPMGQQGGRQWHQKHPLHFNPLDPDDDALYTAIGIPCNLCMVEKDERYGTLLKYDLETGAATVLARGVRNSVGFDWNPDTGQIWFSDNNRQNFTNADEINVITRQNQHFGVPYVFGKNTIGYTQDEWEGTSTLPPNQPYLVRGAILADMPPSEISTRRYVAPALALGSNTAPLGVKFIGDGFYPGASEGSQRMLVALHSGGSEDGGIDVRMMAVVGSKVVSVLPLVTGWRQPGGDVIGRPVDFLPLKDGSVLISDDIAGVIYRVFHDPASVPDTTVSLTMAAAPGPSASDQIPVGYLTDPRGRRRRLELGWTGPALEIPGLAYGSYVLELTDIGGEWVPIESRIEFELSAETPARSISLGYRGIPDIEARVTITAPARPAGSNVPAQWIVKLVNLGRPTEAKEIGIAWGGSTVETLGYGTYELISPYLTVALPVPSKARFSVVDAGEQNAPALGYRIVANVGAAMVAAASGEEAAGACWGCHKNGFKNQSMAFMWQEAGRPALVAKIKSMSDRIDKGHCDDVCAGETADHLFNDVWNGYLNPGDPYGTRQLRKLSTSDYVNTVQDVLNVQVNPDYLPGEGIERDFGYPGQARRGLLGKNEVLAYYTEAIRVAKAVDLEGLGYQPGNPDAFVAVLGRRLFRRSLDAAELARYKALLEREGEELEGPRLMIAGMLSSPNFLYRSELGLADASRSSKGIAYRLTPNELATALSFGFLGTTPSDALLDKAEAGQLETEEQIAAEIDAMLATDRGKEQFLRFIRYYTRTYGVVPEKPGLDEATIDAMRREQGAFVRHVISDPSGSFEELFSPGYTFLNQKLALHYGISGVSGDAMQKKDVDALRGGLLHQGVVPATQAGTESTSLVKRGFLVREQMFCRQFGAMENDNRVPTFPDRPVSTRERMNLINGPVNPSCWTCHQYVNDLGAGFENYDAAGKFRAQEFAVNNPYRERLVDIDASGEFLNNAGAHAADFEDLRGVARIIPHSPSAMQCLADSYYRYLYGEVPIEASGLIISVRENLKNSGKLHDALRMLGTSNALRYRKEHE